MNTQHNRNSQPITHIRRNFYWPMSPRCTRQCWQIYMQDVFFGSFIFICTGPYSMQNTYKLSKWRLTLRKYDTYIGTCSNWTLTKHVYLVTTKEWHGIENQLHSQPIPMIFFPSPPHPHTFDYHPDKAHPNPHPQSCWLVHSTLKFTSTCNATYICMQTRTSY